jgi:hypothetical protein
LFVSRSKVKGQKNIFFENAQNLMKLTLGGVLRLDDSWGGGVTGGGGHDKGQKNIFFENAQNLMKLTLGGDLRQIKNQ